MDQEASRLVDALITKDLRLVLAESCTGGMVAAELVDNGRWQDIEQLAREAMTE